jgi:hypothetical protein
MRTRENIIKTSDLMQRVRNRVIDRHGEAILSDRKAAIVEMLQLAPSYLKSDAPRLPGLLVPGREWDLQLELKLGTHRPLIGRILVGVKRLMMPPLRWLFEYSQVNFSRQKRLNRAVLESLEILLVETAWMRVGLRRLEEQRNSASHGPACDLTSEGDESE